MKRKKIILMIGKNDRYGGATYEKYLSEILDYYYYTSHLFLDFGNNKIYTILKAVKLSLLLLINQFKLKNSIVIKNITTLLIPSLSFRKNIIIVHHLDFSQDKYRYIYKLFEKIIYKNLRKAAAIVVVSSYWKRYLNERGFTNVWLIYNPFDTKKIIFSPEEIRNFKERYGLTGKPIIYLGSFGKAKGTEKVYDAIKGLDAFFVSSGGAKVKDIPFINLNLNYRDYLLLLKASSVAVTMSEFDEGWCRVAHEAMLCGTPVVGSGRGGMEELLNGGKQVICRKFKELRNHIVMLLKDAELRRSLGTSGFKYASEFNIERFNRCWIDLIENITNE